MYRSALCCSRHRKIFSIMGTNWRLNSFPCIPIFMMMSIEQDPTGVTASQFGLNVKVKDEIWKGKGLFSGLG